MLFCGWTNELVARQFAVGVFVEVLEAGFEVVLSLQTGLVFVEREDSVLIRVPANKGFWRGLRESPLCRSSSDGWTFQ